MTTKATEKPVQRLVDGNTFGPLVVGVTALELQLRQKGRRGATSLVSVPWGWLYQIAVERTSERRRATTTKKKRRALPLRRY